MPFLLMLQGVARGLGWQHMVVVVNLASYYAVGMPIAAIAGFKFKLYAKVREFSTPLKFWADLRT